MYKTIIVDDEVDIREGLVHIIDWQAFGFEIVGLARNGLEALEVIPKHLPSLVITDIRMPEMDGIMLIREIRTMYPSTRIIILSGYDDFTYAKEAIKHGASDYLLKPVDTDELCSALKKIHTDLHMMQEHNKDFREVLSLHWDNSNLLTHLRNRDVIAITLDLELLFEELRDKKLSSNAINHIIIDLLSDLSHHLRGNNTSWRDLSSDFVMLVDEALGLNDLYTLHRLIAEGFLSAIEQRASSLGIVDKVLDHIKCHFNEELSIKMLSGLYFINPSYLGQMIRKKENMNFNEYINRIRIEEAKNLLMHTDISIKEICDKVGYKHIDHFYKNFKGITGKNPGAYRKGA